MIPDIRLAASLPALLLGLSLFASTASAAPAGSAKVSFTRQVMPILRASCVGCHGEKNPSSKLSLVSYAALKKGGEKGAAIEPGKGAQSRLVKYLTGELQPKMPIGGELKAAEIALIRQWIDEGAVSDGAPTAAVSPPAKALLRTNLTPPATAIAYSPDGKWLAVATYQEVQLWDVASLAGGTGAASNGPLPPAAAPSPRRILRGHADAVQSLAFSPDGAFLAAGGGEPGVEGEIRIWRVETGMAVRRLGEHTDAVTALAYSTDGKTLASGSIDKSLRFWDAATGKVLRVVKDHADAIYAAAFSPDGKWLATAGADRSIKLWDTGAQKRRYTLTGHNDIVYALAFAPDSQTLASGAADKSVRIWEIGAEEGKIRRTLSGHGHTVHAVAYGPEGRWLVSASADHTVRVWDPNSGEAIRTLEGAKEWVYGVAVRPGAPQVAACAWDGAVLLWNPDDGKALATLKVALPSPAVARDR